MYDCIADSYYYYYLLVQLCAAIVQTYNFPYPKGTYSEQIDSNEVSNIAIGFDGFFWLWIDQRECEK